MGFTPVENNRSGVTCINVKFASAKVWDEEKRDSNMQVKEKMSLLTGPVPADFPAAPRW